jgi:hypothetical protein
MFPSTERSVCVSEVNRPDGIRPVLLRIDFPGAAYHVTSRGDRRDDISADDEDRQGLLASPRRRLRASMPKHWPRVLRVFRLPDVRFVSAK